ncbi:MAG: peptide chain release factor N(5)-glutamine methyltransferase [Actinomyces sp.]|jgi:release factor glutamine methyltransferase|nr:peptide chain release factor N(5)-glutamine methyltransferase [Actinomyces sp.]MCI1640968.1 peptide chain release factor N(5)-glutamine methyltransferase [Actinomyces sp.]MCI1661336.1 peptide chain release factor N(5)-glutamine methyltransferase [Actinomyces sp.]MCI1690344.1 peptide chain release factor N(5)-glutamine methyltransferase [Actinomyces sp.]MCI1786985.1 peptide chain release factor N(5)-glutamine methyltransferase [Actinomyces sp.]MCI1829449.1 peptide chain release factor N(5)-g
MTDWSGSSTQAQMLAWARGRLRGLPGSNPSQEARALLEWALGVESLWSAPDVVGARAAERLRSGVARRRHREPLQHITGRMWFRGLALEARPGVFVVRPETEVVAGAAIDAAGRVPAGSGGGPGGAPLVADLCAGSGAIAVSVACEVPAARVVAVELDPRAVALARANVRALAPDRVVVVHGDATSALEEWDGRVDVVVSNPPYVPSADRPTQAEALADPEAALFGGGEDGLVVPRGIVHRAARLLAPGGTLVVEHAESQSAALRGIAAQAGLVGARTLPDLAGRDRMLVASRPGEDDV